MKNHKATGPDGIPADLWKTLGDTGVEWLTILFNNILSSNRIPEAWRHSYLLPFYKNKGDVSDCGNYRGIKLTSHTLKIWERILHNRFLKLVAISDNQCGFTASRSTTDAIQTVRILMEKGRSNHEDLHLVFIPIADKVKESRMRWYGHVMRRSDDHVVKKALALPDNKRGRGRPLATWWSTISKDLKQAQLNEETTQDRPTWRMRTRRADPK
ncbi:hypothetical protein MSG28_003410 [Choristoneura fumiferana]|uniref:Uncharacterized protein n=1 Tax=Choristoneura fumiferana TaxID=7141 RepID=A0ACC0KEN7_CHOFU|nr:hypothetical protein MSG28_003410 [Choristoneura fumiferana]